DAESGSDGREQPLQTGNRSRVHHLCGAEVDRHEGVAVGSYGGSRLLDTEPSELVVTARRQPMRQDVERPPDGAIRQLPPDKRLRPTRLARGKRDYGLVLEAQFGKAWSAAIRLGKAHA